MNFSGIQSELDLLKRKCTKLEYDFKTARLTIDEHCWTVKSKIDFQAEFMIKKINKERLKLISQIDEYQEKLFQGLEERIDKPKVESTLKEARDFIKSEPSQIDLIQQKLDTIKLEEQSLKERLFNRFLIDFESIETPVISSSLPS
jgi:hypothetical protein